MRQGILQKPEHGKVRTFYKHTAPRNGCYVRRISVHQIAVLATARRDFPQNYSQRQSFLISTYYYDNSYNYLLRACSVSGIARRADSAGCLISSSSNLILWALFKSILQIRPQGLRKGNWLKFIELINGGAVTLSWVCWVAEILCLVEVRICDQISRMTQPVFIQYSPWARNCTEIIE